MKSLFFTGDNQPASPPLPNPERKLGSRRMKTGALLLLLLSPFASDAVDPVRLQLKWKHQFQFAGYYAAQAQGYYKAAGLDVEILPRQPGVNAAQQVLQGKAEFGVGTTDLLLLREQGQPVVALAVIFQHSPMALMTLKQDGIQSVHDLAGQKLMVETEATELYAYLEKEGVSAEEYTLIPHSLQTEDLLSGKVDALSIYVTDELFELRAGGHDYLLYSPRSAGIDFYGDNLFTTEQQLEQNPERVRAFREASLKGWVYAMANPEEMVQLIYSRYSQQHSIEHLRFEADQMAPLLQTSLVEIGHMNPGRWRHIAETYADLGLMKPDVDLEGFLYAPNPPPPDLFGLSIFVGAAILVVVGILAVALFIYRANVRLRREGEERRLAKEQVAALLEESNQSRNALQGIIEDEEQSRAALCESEARYRTLFDRAQDGILILSFKGKVLSVNDSFARMHGYSNEEILGLSLKDIDVPESAQRIAERMAHLKAGQSLTFEVEHYHKDGHVFPLEVSAAPIVIDGETLMQCFHRDITERKETEAALVRKDREISQLKDFSIGLSTMASGENLEEYIAKELKEICRATGVIFNEYDSDRKVLLPLHLEVKSKIFDLVQKQLKHSSKDMSIPVSDEMFETITSHVIGVRKTLHEITYGATPKPIGVAIQKLLKADRFIGIPYFIEGRLYGTSVLAMGKDVPDPSRELLENLALLSAVTLRRKQAEIALCDRNNELERFNKAAVGRELRMVELKIEINRLCRNQGTEEPYPLHSQPPEGTNV